MDPSLIINESSCYSAANPSYSLAELWPFPIAGGGGGAGEGKEGGPFGPPMPCLTASELDPTPASSALSVDQESTLTHQSPCPKRKYFLNSEPDSSNPVLSATTPTHINDANAKRIKASGGGGRGVREENDDSKAEAEAETSSQTGNKPSDHQNTKNEPPKDYIHVRARRGQATDSHSLAERARREKISERMKILQDLVPGCNKVIGKALVLDEIINYIQSLQHQVEFLSMKLEAVNSRMNPAIEGFPSKDLAGPPFDAAAMIFGQQAAREYAQVAQAEWLHMQVGSNFERAT